MIKIDDKEIRNPIEQIKKNMDDIENLKNKIYEVYNYNGVIGSTETPYVSRSSTNVPEDVNKGWLVDYTGKLFKITGGNTTTLLLDYYANIKGIKGDTGDQGEQGIQGDPGVGIVSIEKTSSVGLVDTYTIIYTNGQMSTFTVTNGEKGDPGDPAPTYIAGDNIQINNSTKAISANENIIPKAFNTYVLGDNTHSYKEVVANKFKSPNSYYEMSGANISGHGQVTIKTTNGGGTNEAQLQLGKTGLYTNKNIAPMSGSTVNLGQATNGFNNLYLDGAIIGENNLTKGLQLPDTTGWEEDKTIATIDQIPTVEANTGETPSVTLTNLQVGSTVYEIPQGGGSTYTAGDGIDITNDVISVDNTVALKSEIPDVSDFVTDSDLQTELQNYVTNSSLTTTLEDYELKADAFSGSYNDLTDKPTIPTKTSDLTNDSGYITGVSWNDVSNKPTFATVATSGDYDDLTDKPDLSNFVTSSELQTELQNYVESSDLATVATSGEYSDLIGTPTLATVATTGDYDDLTNKPTIPVVPTNVSSFNNDAGYITNAALTPYVEASSLATVATSGDYDDLINKPTIPTVPITSIHFNSNEITPVSGDVAITQAQANWNETNISNVSYIQNKPVLAQVATSGSYNDLTDKPTIPTVSYPVTDVQVDGSSVLDGTVAKITMPTLPSVIGDISYLTDFPLDFNEQGTYSCFKDQLKDRNGNTPTTINIGDIVKAKWSDTYGIVTSFSNDIAGVAALATKVTANSSSTPSATLTNLQVGDTLYSIPQAPDLTNYIEKSQTAGLVKNDGTIDTNTYLTTAPVTSVNGQTGAVSLTIPAAQVNSDWNAVSGVAQILNKPTIPEDTIIIALTGTTGTISASDLAKVIANPEKIIIEKQLNGTLAYKVYLHYYMKGYYNNKYFYVYTVSLDDGNDSPTSNSYQVIKTYHYTIWSDTGNYSLDYYYGLRTYDSSGGSSADFYISGNPNHNLRYKSTNNSAYGVRFPETSAYTADKTIATTDQILGSSTEVWTFTLADGTTTTKTIVLG